MSEGGEGTNCSVEETEVDAGRRGSRFKSAAGLARGERRRWADLIASWFVSVWVAYSVWVAEGQTVRCGTVLCLP